MNTIAKTKYTKEQKTANKKLYKRCYKAVNERLSGKRLDHVISVSKCAAKLAKIYDVNKFDARLAGLLHDWDKLYTDDELLDRLKELDMEVPEHYELLWPVLHAFTGAQAIKREFPEVPEQVISAIYHHTLGGVDLSDLDMVIFIADLIEPLRDAKRRPGTKELRNLVGKVSLEQLYFASYIEVMHALIARNRFIHPSAFEIWNGLVARYADHSRQKKNQGNPNIVA